LWRPLHEAGGDPLYNNPCFWWGASGNNNSNFWEGEYYNPDSHKKEVYSHKKIITLDQLPDLQNYPME